jgi:pyruvate/2-oxoacid:ferredoxin oxidoreductase alpha subunit
MYSSEKRVPIIGFVAGLGGREITIRSTREMFEIVQQTAEKGEVDQEVQWIGVRE